jgi:hypothetical protein
MIFGIFAVDLSGAGGKNEWKRRWKEREKDSDLVIG